MMIKPEVISIQEIKVGSKSKIADMVAIRHAAANNEQVFLTTYILLPFQLRNTYSNVLTFFLFLS